MYISNSIICPRCNGPITDEQTERVKNDFITSAYLGTMDVVQDLTSIKKLEGEKRLLEWKQ